MNDNTESSLESLSSNFTVRIKAQSVHLGLALIGFAPLLWVFCVASWKRPAYQFFPLAFVAAGILGWRILKEKPFSATGGNPRATQIMGLSAAGLYLLACIFWSPWVAYVAFLLAVVTVLWSLGGWFLVKAFVPVCLMLLTILPPPLNGDQTLTLWLRAVAVRVSSALLDWLHVTHAQDGNTILLPGKSVLVEEACSGINSFILCNAFCLFWCLWQRRGVRWTILAMTAISFFVVLGNIIRITAGAAANYFWKFDLLSGRPHEIFGLVLLLSYCGLVLSSDQFLFFLTDSNRAPAAGTQKKEDPSAPAATGAANSVFGFKSISIVLAVFGVSFFAAHLVLGGRHGVAELPSLASVRELKLSLPENLAGWQRMNADTGTPAFVQTLGVRSQTWNYQRAGVSVTVAVDYPLDGYHNVRGCYTGAGWEVLEEKELSASQAGEDLHAVKLSLQKSLQHAEVLHSVVDPHGGWLTAPLNVASRFSDTLAARPVGYRVQLIATAYMPISPVVGAQCQAFFLQARQILVQQVISDLKSGAK